MASNRLDTLRGLLLQELGPFGRFTATGNGDAGGNTVLCSTAFRSSSLTSSSLAYEWLMVPSFNVPRQRRITKTGLTNTATGEITLDAPLSAQVTTNTIFEVSGTLPLDREYNAADIGSAMMTGATECLNAALRHIEVPDSDLSVTLVDGQYDYSLAAYPWLDRARRLVDVRQVNATGTAWVSATDQGHPWEVREDIEGLVLHFKVPYRTSGSSAIRLQVLRPADTKISGSESTTGLVNDNNTCGSDPNAIIPVAKVFAYAALRDSRADPAKSYYHALYEKQVVEARRVKGYIHDDDVDPSVPKAPEAAA